MLKRILLTLALLGGLALPVSAQTQRGLENCTTDGTSEDLVSSPGTHHTTDSGSWTELFDTGGNQIVMAVGSGGNANTCIADPGGSSRSLAYTMTVGSALPSADYDVFATITQLP